jgi:membrane-associated protease RseP (regulator of RpoE activity)
MLHSPPVRPPCHLSVPTSGCIGAKPTPPQVVAPLPDGPAERAGIRPGDVLVAVDGKPTKGISLYDASDLLQVWEDLMRTEALLSHTFCFY